MVATYPTNRRKRAWRSRDRQPTLAPELAKPRRIGNVLKKSSAGVRAHRALEYQNGLRARQRPRRFTSIGYASRSRIPQELPCIVARLPPIKPAVGPFEYDNGSPTPIRFRTNSEHAPTTALGTVSCRHHAAIRQREHPEPRQRNLENRESVTSHFIRARPRISLRAVVPLLPGRPRERSRKLLQHGFAPVATGSADLTAVVLRPEPSHR